MLVAVRLVMPLCNILKFGCWNEFSYIRARYHTLFWGESIAARRMVGLSLNQLIGILGAAVDGQKGIARLAHCLCASGVELVAALPAFPPNCPVET